MSMSSPEVFQHKSHSSEGFHEDDFCRLRKSTLSTQYRDIEPYHLKGPAKAGYQDCTPLAYWSSARSNNHPDMSTSWVHRCDIPDIENQQSDSYSVLGSRDSFEYTQPRNDCTLDSLNWGLGMQYKSRLAYPRLLSPRSLPQDADQMESSTVSSMSEIHPSTVYPNLHLEHLSYPNMAGHYQFSQQSPVLTSLEKYGIHSPYEMLRTQSPEMSQSLSPSNRTGMCVDVTPEPTRATGQPASATNVADIDDSDNEKATASEPYAQLIYRALMSATEHKMVLRDIYDWFEKNTDKANSSGKGWQNSIRHNLSMNGAFRKVDLDPPSEDSKKGFIWVLEPSAITHGVESTTRYRRTAPHKKSSRADPTSFHRQKSSLKGDRVTKRSTKVRRRSSLKCDGLGGEEWYGEKAAYENGLAFPADPDYSSSMDVSGYDLESIPYYPHPQYSVMQSSSPKHEPYSYANLMGCTSTLGDSPLFFDEQTQHSDPMLLSHSLFELGDRGRDSGFDCSCDGVGNTGI